MKKHIPNLLTMLNLFSGCVAIFHANTGNFKFVFIWLCIAAIFDFFDGFAARLLHVSSPIGKELDSLADVVSFGVAPAMALFFLIKTLLPVQEIALYGRELLLPFVAFLLPMFSALRLAKFNLDERQTTHFIGLPTPANAFFWSSFCYAYQAIPTSPIFSIYIIVPLIILFSCLLISGIPMFSLKVKKLNPKMVMLQVLLLILVVLLVSFFGVIGVSVAIVAYVIVSLLARRMILAEI